MSFVKPMSSLRIRCWLPLVAVGAVACQPLSPLPSPMSYGNAVPIYATRSEAQAVAVGQFGAVPVEIAAGVDLVVIAVPCAAEVAQVRSRLGRLAWVPMDSLPPRTALPACIEKAPPLGKS